MDIEKSSLEGYENYIVYSIDDIIPEEQESSCPGWKYQPLYKEDLKGAIREWWIGFDYSTNEIVIGSGIANGVITIARSEVILNNSNRNMYKQSLQEILNRRKKKYREGYRTDSEEPPEIKKPMLANLWEPSKTRLTYPVGVQPKLDGVRCMARIEDSQLILRSRNNLEYKTMLSFFKNLEDFITLIPYNCELDGELWVKGAGFNEITGTVKCPSGHPETMGKLKYNIFTYNTRALRSAEDRYNDLVKAFQTYKSAFGAPSNFRIVPMKVARSKESIDELHHINMKNRYEGSMIYKFSNIPSSMKNQEAQLTPAMSKALSESLYKAGGRSNNLLKWKMNLDGRLFIDEEGEIVGYKEAKGTDKGTPVFSVKSSNGKIFGVRMQGTLAQRRALFEVADTLIGRSLSYKYTELTEDGAPRFPSGIAVRDYE